MESTLYYRQQKIGYFLLNQARVYLTDDVILEQYEMSGHEERKRPRQFNK